MPLICKRSDQSPASASGNRTCGPTEMFLCLTHSRTSYQASTDYPCIFKHTKIIQSARPKLLTLPCPAFPEEPHTGSDLDFPPLLLFFATWPNPGTASWPLGTEYKELVSLSLSCVFSCSHAWLSDHHTILQTPRSGRCCCYFCYHSTRHSFELPFMKTLSSTISKATQAQVTTKRE